MTLPHLIRDWPSQWSELLAERIAIMIEDGHLSEEDAKREAEEDIRRMVEQQREMEF